MTRTIEISAFAAAILVAALATHAWLASRDDQRRLQSTLAAQQKTVSDAAAREATRNASLAGALAQIAKLKAAAQTPQEIVHDLPKYLALPQPITLAGEPASSSLSPQEALSPQIPRTQDYRDYAARARGPVVQQGTGTSNSPMDAHQPLPANTSDDLEKGTALPEKPAGLANPSAASPTPAVVSPTSAEIPAADLKPLYDYVQDCRATQAQLAVAQQNASDDATRIAAISRERDAAVTASKGGSFLRRLRRNAEWLAIGAAAGAVAASAIHTSLR